jgi:hypothetical protein
LLWTAVDAIEVVLLAFETNAFVFHRPHGLRIVFVAGMDAVRAEFGAQPAGDAGRTSLDGKFSDGVAKARPGFPGLRQWLFFGIMVHGLS